MLFFPLDYENFLTSLYATRRVENIFNTILNETLHLAEMICINFMLRGERDFSVHLIKALFKKFENKKEKFVLETSTNYRVSLIPYPIVIRK